MSTLLVRLPDDYRDRVITIMYYIGLAVPKFAVLLPSAKVVFQNFSAVRVYSRAQPALPVCGGFLHTVLYVHQFAEVFTCKMFQAVRCLIISLPGMLNGTPGLEEVTMTTNGVTLARKLPALKSAGLAGLNVSLDTLNPAKFQFITRRNGMHRVLEAIQQAVTMEINQVKVLC